MPTRTPKKETNYWTLMVVIIIPILTWAGGTLTTAWTYFDKVATKGLLDERFKELVKYTDDKTTQIYRMAIEHDEKSRAEMVLRTETMLNELKIRNAVVDTKIETIMKATAEIKSMAIEQNRSMIRDHTQRR